MRVEWGFASVDAKARNPAAGTHLFEVGSSFGAGVGPFCYSMRMETLFSEIDEHERRIAAPLAVRMRPNTLDELVGQEQAVGPGSWLRAAI